MSPEEKRPGSGQWAGAAVSWLAVCCAAVCVAVLGLLSVERPERRWSSPVEIENAYVALAVGQTFFLVFILPLFEKRWRHSRSAGDLGSLAVRIVGLLVLSSPLVLLTLRTCETGWAAALRSQALLLLMGLTVGLAVRMPRAVSWYYPGAFLLSAAVPLAAYLLREEGGVPTGWARVVSPFWAAGSAACGGEVAGPLIFFGCLGAAALLLLRTGAPEQP